MSIINQMLRDLDGRGKTLESSPAGSALQAGTQSVPYLAPLPPVPSRRRHTALALLLLCLLTAGGLLAWQFELLPALPGAQPVAQVPATAASMPAASTHAVAVVDTAVPESPAGAALAAAMQALDAPVSLRIDAQLDHRPVAPVATKERKPSVATPPVVKATVASVDKPAVPPPATNAVAAVSPVAPAAEKALPASAQEPGNATGQRQVAAVRDALLQAQGLWGLGNQSGAIDLLREVLQAAEKSLQQPGMDSTLVAVVRELARMQMATGRVAEAHEVLVHFEGRLKTIPEAWAMRANAAQRLGQHQDSVQSYMQALQARPNEQRWLLGLAVSLAAMGQTASAGEVAERARAEGPINRDIAAYLRQMGVNTK